MAIGSMTLSLSPPLWSQARTSPPRKHAAKTSGEDKQDGQQIEEMTTRNHLLPRGQISNPGVLRLRSP